MGGKQKARMMFLNFYNFESQIVTVVFVVGT